jgi:hypothetical protein
MRLTSAAQLFGGGATDVSSELVIKYSERSIKKMHILMSAAFFMGITLLDIRVPV